MKKITEQQIKDIATRHGVPYAALRAVIEVEGAGNGFAPDGKILIQFEPLWFKRRFQDWRDTVATSKWVNNKVGTQSVEWPAFNDAFRINPTAAMESTSIGMMQVMGFHWEFLGFKSVGEMWDFAKESEANQIEIGMRFIKKNPKLLTALKKLDWPTFAYYYNGSGYKQFKYDTRLATAYKKYAK